MSIFSAGDAWGLGDADGICMPGILMSICGEAAGCAPGDGAGVWAGMGIPGIFICGSPGEDCDGVAAVDIADAGFDIFIPGIVVAVFLLMRLLLAALLFLTIPFLFLALDLRAVDGFDFAIPGMFCMSWPLTAASPGVNSKPVSMNELNPTNRIAAPKFNVFIIPPERKCA